MTGTLFETERLVVRRLGPADVDALHAVYGDADAMRWVDDGRPLDREACLRWIEVTARNVETRGYGMCALVARHNDHVCGFAGLVHPGGSEVAELKYALRRDAWGRGLATESARALLAWARDSLGLTRVIATAAPENSASHRVLEKIGMRRGTSVRDDDGSEVLVFEWTSDERTACPGCGARLPRVDGPVHRYIESSPACWALYGEVLAREYGDPAFMRSHRLTVDAYAVQHPGHPSPQATQSVTVHLMSLHAVFERAMTHEQARSLIGRATRGRTFTWLEPPANAGKVTIVDVHATRDVEEHALAVERWARSAWEAWGTHHETIRSLVEQVFGR